MGDDIVERAFAGGKFGEALAADLDVGQPQPGDAGLGLFHLPRGNVQAEEPRLGIERRQRDQVAARRAADFQHPRPGQRRGIDPEQAGDPGHPQRVGLRKGLRDIGDCVIFAGIAGNPLVRCFQPWGLAVHPCRAPCFPWRGLRPGERPGKPATRLFP